RGRRPGLHIEFNLYVVRHYHSTAIERAAPGDSVVHTVDGQARIGAQHLAARRGQRPAEREGQINILGHAVNRQRAVRNKPVAFLFYRFSLKGNFGKLLHIQEIRASQVIVAPGGVGVNGRGLDGYFDRRLGRVFVIVKNLTVEVVKPAVHGADHHVFHIEADRRVHRINLVLIRGQGRSAHCHYSRQQHQELANTHRITVSFEILCYWTRQDLEMILDILTWGGPPRNGPKTLFYVIYAGTMRMLRSTACEEWVSEP